MSLSIITQSGIQLVSIGNDNVSTISGTTFGAANVFDYKYIADIYVNGVLQITLKSFPDPNFGFGVFNTRNILSSFVSFDFIPIDTNPFQVVSNCPNTSVVYFIQYGEEYISGNTFAQNRNLVSGSTYTAVNSSLSSIDQLSPFNNYLFSSGGVSHPLILSQKNQQVLNPAFTAQSTAVQFTAFINERQFAYIVNPNSVPLLGISRFTKMFIFTYSDASFQNIIGQYIYTPNFQGNPLLFSGHLSGSTNVQAIATGYPQVSSIPSGTTSLGTLAISFGPFPMIGPTVKSYAILPTSDNFQWQPICMVIASDCGRTANTAYTVSWLNALGGFDSWLFNKKDETTQNIQREKYKKVSGKLNSDGSFTVNTYSRNQVPYYTVLQDSIVMNTDLLTDQDVLFLKTLVSSPAVFITDQNGLTTAVTIEENSYRINKVVNQKIYSLQMTVNQSYNDYRQLL